MTLDVRLVLALPDYSTPQEKDLRTLFMLGNQPRCKAATDPGAFSRVGL
jgi:hypothetical protein